MTIAVIKITVIVALVLWLCAMIALVDMFLWILSS
jgi:hypothetical protein